MIFDDNSTIENKKQAFLILQSWKVRRSQETLTGVLCTLSLLDVHLKDETGKISDPFTLSTLYASTLTKFINFATSFQINNTSMYRSANKLGLDSFLVDLRHMCAHGKQQPSLEVFRKSHRYCLNWIKNYFWLNELNNVSDATSKDIRYDEAMANNLKEKFSIFDMVAELLHKNVLKFKDLADNESARQRWPTINQFIKDKKLRDFRHAFSYLTTELSRVLESKEMSTSPRTFFHEMLERCEFFMHAADYCDKEISERDASDEDDESSGTQAKRRKKEPMSVVKLYQNLIWLIAKNEYLKLFLDMLYQVSLNESENTERRASASFWITIILGSLKYYQRYCEFSNDGAILQTKISEDIRNIYSYQLDADLTKVIVFVGTQMQPNSIKYSREFFNQILNNVDESSVGVCISLLHFIYPPLDTEQLDRIRELINIKTGTKNSHSPQLNQTQRNSTTLQSLAAPFEAISTNLRCFPDEQETLSDKTTNAIWEKSKDSIDWSTQPIGKNFSFQL